MSPGIYQGYLVAKLSDGTSHTTILKWIPGVLLTSEVLYSSSTLRPGEALTWEHSLHEFARPSASSSTGIRPTLADIRSQIIELSAEMDIQQFKSTGPGQSMRANVATVRAAPIQWRPQ